MPSCKRYIFQLCIINLLVSLGYFFTFIDFIVFYSITFYPKINCLPMSCNTLTCHEEQNEREEYKIITRCINGIILTTGDLPLSSLWGMSLHSHHCSQAEQPHNTSYNPFVRLVFHKMGLKHLLPIKFCRFYFIKIPFMHACFS